MAQKTILIVDDDDSTSMLFAMSLTKLGFAAKSFVSADDALKYLHANALPDLILLDILLPGDMNGIDFLAKIKGDPSTKEIPVVVISNTMIKSHEQDALALGADHIFTKAETSLKQLTDYVGAFLSGRDASGREHTQT